METVLSEKLWQVAKMLFAQGFCEVSIRFIETDESYNFYVKRPNGDGGGIVIYRYDLVENTNWAGMAQHRIEMLRRKFAA